MKFNGTGISIIRGDSDSLTIAIKGGAFVDGEDKVEMTVRRKAECQEKVFYKCIEAFDDGKAVVPFEPEDTESIPFGSYVYDVQWTDAEGKIRTIIKPSQFYVREEVTYG